MAEAFARLTGYCRIVNDVVIYDSDTTQHIDHVRQFLQWRAERQITLNTDKWEFAQSKVTFARFIVSEQGYCTDRSITDAISSFLTPANRTDLHVFFGLANQLSASTAMLTNLLAPMRPLLRKKMSSHGHLTSTMHSPLPRRPSHLPPPFPSLTRKKPHAFVLMPAIRALDLYCSRRVGPSSRLAPGSSQIPSQGMPSLSWRS